MMQSDASALLRQSRGIVFVTTGSALRRQRAAPSEASPQHLWKRDYQAPRSAGEAIATACARGCAVRCYVSAPAAARPLSPLRLWKLPR